MLGFRRYRGERCTKLIREQLGLYARGHGGMGLENAVILD